jgi:hypothetical protein
MVALMDTNLHNFVSFNVKCSVNLMKWRAKVRISDLLLLIHRLPLSSKFNKSEL